MNSQETLCLMALTRVPCLSLTNAKSLMNAFGSASVVYENRTCLRDALPSARKSTLDALKAMDTHMERAEQEL